MEYGRRRNVDVVTERNDSLFTAIFEVQSPNLDSKFNWELIEDMEFGQSSGKGLSNFVDQFWLGISVCCRCQLSSEWQCCTRPLDLP